MNRYKTMKTKTKTKTNPRKDLTRKNLQWAGKWLAKRGLKFTAEIFDHFARIVERGEDVRDHSAKYHGKTAYQIAKYILEGEAK